MRAILAALMLFFAAALAPPANPFARQASAEVASWYGEGRRTASGERFNPQALTAAHRTLPFGTFVRVCRDFSPAQRAGNSWSTSAKAPLRRNLRAVRCVVVRINDRGPASWSHRDIDLSTAAARAIGLTEIGVGQVSLEVLQ
jgi:rare lipoprotein A